MLSSLQSRFFTILFFVFLFSTKTYYVFEFFITPPERLLHLWGNSRLRLTGWGGGWSRGGGRRGGEGGNTLKCFSTRCQPAGRECWSSLVWRTPSSLWNHTGNSESSPKINLVTFCWSEWTEKTSQRFTWVQFDFLSCHREMDQSSFQSQTLVTVTDPNTHWILNKQFWLLTPCTYKDHEYFTVKISDP